MVSTRCASWKCQFGALKEEVAHERLGHCRGKSDTAPRHALSSEYAPDSATAEGGSIVYEPGEC